MNLYPPLIAYPNLGTGIRVLIYNGVFDMDCNFMGTDKWLQQMQWPGADKWHTLGRMPWKVTRASGGGTPVVAGHTRALGNLTQLTLLGAGHLVPMDQPRTALLMLHTFLAGQPFTNSSVAIHTSNLGRGGTQPARGLEWIVAPSKKQHLRLRKHSH